MKKCIITVLLVATITILAIAPLCNAASLSKPNVTLPNNWKLCGEIAYPNEISEHDPEGAGLVEYGDSRDYDFVMIYYENAGSTSYSSVELKSEVEDIFYRDHEGLTLSESGTMTVAGVQAGFAKAYDYTYDCYHLELVLVKDNYYINAYAFYDVDNESENNVMTVLNSINVGTEVPCGSMLYVIIGIVAVVAIVVVLLLVIRRKKKADNPQMPAYSNDMPPPPPPLP